MSTAVETQPIAFSTDPPVSQKETTNSLLLSARVGSTQKKIIADAVNELTSKTHNDWRDDLLQDGYVVVKNVIPKEKAKSYQQEAFKWMRSFGNEALDLEDPDTWTPENLPPQSEINSFDSHCMPHEKFMWDARMEPGVLDAFAQLWGTDELLVSFDALNVTLPNLKDKKRLKRWPHFDQSPNKEGLQCAQGIISLSHHGEEDGGLVVYRGTHKLFKEFFDTKVAEGEWDASNYFELSDEHLDWFLKQGCEQVKVCCEPGDLIIWDSRTCHWGMEPTQKSKTVRTVIYACYTPAKFATEEILAERAEAFKEWKSTTHWPHAEIVVLPQVLDLPNGTKRSEPIEKPVIDEKLLKLVGALRY